MARRYVNEIGDPHATYEIDWNNPGEREIVDFVHYQYRAGKDRRMEWEKNAAQRLEWVRGNQDLFWDEAEDLDQLAAWGGLSEEERTLYERFPMSINMLKRFAMSWIGLVLGKPIGWHCLPVTSDPDDIQAAKLQGELLDYYWQAGITHGMTRLLDALWHMYAAGIIWLHPWWDAQKHYAEHFSQATDQKNLPQGDLVFDFATGFDLTEPEGCRCVDEAAWLIHSRLETIEWGLERYGEAFKDVHPDSRVQDHKLHTYQMAGLTKSGSGVDDSSAPDDRVLVHRLWRPKSATVPKGFFAVIADNQLITDGPHPYKHGRLPFIALREQPDYENFRPGCSVADLMDLQWARNKNRSQRQAHFDLSVNPRIMAERNIGLSEDAFKWDGPNVIEVNQNVLSAGKIQPFIPPPIPSDAYRLDEINKIDMQDVAGVHPSTMGRPESAQQSGKHAQLMTQGDARTNTVTRILLEKELAKGGQQGLWLLWEFVDAERMIPIVGQNKIAQVRKFKGADLIGKTQGKIVGPYEFNVRVTLGVEPNMEAVLAKIDMLTERGWLNPQRESDRLLVHKWLGEEYVGPGAGDVTAAHRTRAQDENTDLLEGDSVLPVSGGDDDEVHLYEHQLFRATAGEYRQRLAQDPELDVRFEKHIQRHLANAARKMIEPQMMAAEVRLAMLPEFPRVAAAMQAQQLQQQAGGEAPGNGAATRRRGIAME